ncbi:A-kinase-interacting protein 1 [Pseudorasbora parva]|uniref:A-kinase-interacting protein 1 n=1 Tax=Pseudorasbora parva TaxID=51549 RepID=UPI00351EAA35
MACESWLESSLRRSSKLGQEVLEKAKKRSASSSSARPRPSPMFSRYERNSERDISHSDLDHAFATIADYMSETTRQCQKFYKTAHLSQPREREHICRYHSQQMLRKQKQNATAAIKRDNGSSEPEDFLIEVSPGTYTITAAMQDTRPETKTVHINAGESMSLTFNL